MTLDIQPFIGKRPHLKEPLEFYTKWQRFHDIVDSLVSQKGSASLPDGSRRAYLAESAGPILQAFSTVFGLPAPLLAPLEEALLRGEMDFLRLPLDGYPALSLPYSEEEGNSLLFLLSRPYFLELRESCVMDEGSEWEGGRCPFCSAAPAFASIIEGPKRQLHCSWCGTVGSYRFIGCPNCGSVDGAELGTLVPEGGEEGFRVSTCDACQTYVKVAERRILEEMNPDLADLVSLPLDIVAQGKGFSRRSPNPIGLFRIV